MARRAKKGEEKFLDQCAVLAERWNAIDPAAIGLSPQAVDDFDQTRAQAQAAFDEARRAQTALASAMQRKRVAMGGLRTRFGAATASVAAHAKTTGDPDVYAMAGIDAPQKPGRRPAPPTPTMRRPRVLGYGPIELRFSTSGEGVQYEIQRSVVALDNRVGPWELLAIAGHHRVRDRRVPRGVAAVRYRVRARRTTGKTSDWSNAAEVGFGCAEGAFAVLGGAGEGSAGGGVRAA